MYIWLTCVVKQKKMIRGVPSPKGGVISFSNYAWTLRSILRCWLAASSVAGSTVLQGSKNNCFLDEGDDVIFQLVGGLGKLSGVGGSKHLLPAKQGEPLLLQGVDDPDPDPDPGDCSWGCTGLC